MVFLGDNRTACFGFVCLFVFVLDGGSQKHIQQDDESIEELINILKNEYLKFSVVRIHKRDVQPQSSAGTTWHTRDVEHFISVTMKCTFMMASISGTGSLIVAIASLELTMQITLT